MSTRGSLDVLGGTCLATLNEFGHLPQPKKPEYILSECAEIREARDSRVDRAIRIVKSLTGNTVWPLKARNLKNSTGTLDLEVWDLLGS